MSFDAYVRDQFVNGPVHRITNWRPPVFRPTSPSVLCLKLQGKTATFTVVDDASTSARVQYGADWCNRP